MAYPRSVSPRRQGGGCIHCMIVSIAQVPFDMRMA